MKNLVDFIIDAAKNNVLADEFEKHILGSDHSTISSWFKDNGYDVHEDECKKMTENKDKLKESKVGIY